MMICTIKLGKEYCPPFVVPSDIDIDALSSNLGKNYMLDGATLYQRGVYNLASGTLVPCSKVLHRWKGSKNEGK